MKTVVIVILALLLAGALCALVALYNALKAVRKSERMKQHFLQNINNEFRVPLKVFGTLADTLGKEDLYLSRNDKRNIQEQLQYNASMIATLMDEVLMFTEAEKSERLLSIDSFSPNELCRRCLQANMHSIYHCKQVKLTFKRELSDELFINSDRHLVELIVSKLIINACKFTEEGEITVGCHTKGRKNALTIYVCDTGKGIPEGRRGNIFTYFDEPDNLADEAELDLSVCQRVAEKLGGELIYDESFHPGTQLLLVLPLR